MKDRKVAKKLTKAKKTEKKVSQLERQLKMLYDMSMETRQALFDLIRNYESEKIKYTSQFQTVVDVFENDLGVDRSSIEERVETKFNDNIEKYNKILEERIQSMEEEARKVAEAQAKETTDQAIQFMKQNNMPIPEGILQAEEDLKEAAKHAEEQIEDAKE